MDLFYALKEKTRRRFAFVAETNGLKTKQAKGVVEALVSVACDLIKKNGNFKFARMLDIS